jgi:hypothetical protein
MIIGSSKVIDTTLKSVTVQKYWVFNTIYVDNTLK